MAHKMIKYRLNQDGTIPSFLCLHENGVGGVYGVADSTPSPRDLLMVGITEEASGDFEVIATKADLTAYLTLVGADWMTSGATPDDEMVPFDPVAAADWAWSRLDALNA